MKNLQENIVPASNQNNAEYFPQTNPNAKKDGLRVLYVGNSITKHGYKPDIGWFRDCGMAASDTAHDYVHILQKKIEKHHPNSSFSILQVANFEREFDSKPIETDFLDAINYRADIIIMFFGANVPGDYDTGASTFPCTFGDAYERLRNLLASAKGTKIAHVQGFYIRDRLDAEKQAVAEKYKEPYILLGDIRTREDTHGDFNHPNDLGMQLIAERIWKTVEHWM